MTLFLILIGIVLVIYGLFYMMQHKKKLSDECIVEFEKKIKPKFILFMYLSFLNIIAL
jgi:hypothetical protein